MTRTRTLYPAREVVHLWAHQAQEHAHSRGNRVFFYDDVIFSYGRHFPMARHVEVPGKYMVLYTTRTHSVTTNKYLKHVREALGGHLDYVRVPDLFPDRTNHGHGDNVKHLEWMIADTAARLQRARTNKHYLISSLTYAIENANRYSAFFGMGTTYDVPNGLDLEEQRRLGKVHLDRLEKKRVKYHALLEADRQERLEDYRRLLVRWRAGEKVQLPETPWQLRDEGVALRVRGSRIQTSLGVVVEVTQAVKLWHLVQAGKAVNFGPCCLVLDDPGLVDPAPYIGPYRVTGVLENGDVRVSCHFIKRQEIEAVAAVLGLVDGNVPSWYLDAMGPEVPRTPVRDDVEARRKRTIRHEVAEELNE